jgi:hypothetical protein
MKPGGVRDHETERVPTRSFAYGPGQPDRHSVFNLHGRRDVALDTVTRTRPVTFWPSRKLSRPVACSYLTG